MSLLTLGSNALNANQRALANVGSNIANVNSEGYSRKVTSMSEQGTALSGVKVDVKRMTSNFMVTQLWKDQSALSMDQAMADKIGDLDMIMGSSSNNISTRIDDFFKAANMVSSDPMSVSSRQLFLSQSVNMAEKFNNIDDQISNQNEVVFSEIKNVMHGINELANGIAHLNAQIASPKSEGQSGFEALDERDRLVQELSSLIGINVVTNAKGDYSVFVGQGQPLVIGFSAGTMSVQHGSEDPNKPKILLESGNNFRVDITDKVNGGQLSGILEYRNNILAPARNQMGRLATVFANTMNDQQRSGLDLNGQMGMDLFNKMNSGSVKISTENSATSSSGAMSFYDVSKLTASDYSMRMGSFDGMGNPTFEVTRNYDGKVFKSSTMTSVSSLPPGDTKGLSQDNVFDVTGDTIKFSIDGFTASVKTSTYIKGDRFLLQPTSGAAGLIKSTLSRPDQIAAASPLRTSEGSSNTGSAKISSIKVNNTADSSPLRSGTATLPVQIVVHGPNAFGDDLITLNGPLGPIMSNVIYVEGDVVSVDGYEFTIDGDIVIGDVYDIVKNVDGKSDNKNALMMIDLQIEKTADGKSYQDAYTTTLAWVGTSAQESQLNHRTSKATLSTSKSSLESVRGVNLDEEAALLVKFQHAYSAAAQLISAQQAIFNSLLSAMR